MDTNSIHRILSKSVMFHPPGTWKWEQLQTYSSLNSPADVVSENLNKTILYRDKPFLYSRKWEQLGKKEQSMAFGYPAVYCFELNQPVQGLGTKRKIVNHMVQLNVVYDFDEKLGSTAEERGKRLTREEVYQLMGDHLLYCLEYLSGAVYGSLDGVFQWINEDHKTWLINEGQATTFVQDIKMTRSFQVRFKDLNQNVRMDYVDESQFIGRSVTVQIPDILCQTDLASPSFFVSECCNQI